MSKGRGPGGLPIRLSFSGLKAEARHARPVKGFYTSEHFRLTIGFSTAAIVDGEVGRNR